MALYPEVAALRRAGEHGEDGRTRVMRFMLAALSVGHGVAHLVGFVVPMEADDETGDALSNDDSRRHDERRRCGRSTDRYRWLAIAVAFVVVAGGVVAGWSMRVAVFGLLASLLAFCVIGWPKRGSD